MTKTGKVRKEVVLPLVSIEKLKKQAAADKRSLKNYMEKVLIEVSDSNNKTK